MEAKRRYFGTDGIRGSVGEFPITPDFILKLGWAVGRALHEMQPKNTVLIGKDTRISGYMFESALEAGLAAGGCHIGLLGPMPTSAVAYLTRTLRAQMGIVISASHNPYHDNGIKFFSAGGYKLSKDMELAIEHFIEQPLTTVNATLLGKARRINDASARYIEFCKSSIPHQTSFSDLTIILDCANGSTYQTAGAIFRELGAHVTVLHANPDGWNINVNCGSNHPEVIQQQVVAHRADIGIAFDGDGDRVIMIDHCGEIVDGDELLYIITKGLIAAKRFEGGVIGTQMANQGLERALAALSVPFERVAVGDQHVIAGLLKNQWFLGGEPSGHLIDRRVTTTDDGIIAALQVLQSLTTLNENLHDCKQAMKKYPQIQMNFRYSANKVIELHQAKLQEAIQHAEKKLGLDDEVAGGRIVIRLSGTEPMIRLLIEGKDSQLINSVANDLKQIIEDILNEPNSGNT